VAQPERKPVPPKTTAERVAGSRTPAPARREQPVRREQPARRPDSQRRRQQEQVEEHSNLSTIAIVACSVVAVIAIVIFLVTILNDGLGSKTDYVALPNLVGQYYEDVKDLENFEIVLQDRTYSDEYDADVIAEQVPAFEGQDVVVGTKIYVTVSIGPEPQVKVMENLVNQERTTAENYLDGQGVLFLCTEEPSDTVKEGYVIRTDPVEGSPLAEGQTVMLYISSGPETRKAPMPRLENQSLETARTILKNQKLDLQVKEVEEHSDTVEANCIIRSEPEAGVDVFSGDTVVIYVSKGPETARMPEVVGEDLTTAVKMLNAAGFYNLDYETYVESDMPKDTVVEQSFQAGEAVAINETIVLKLSQGPQYTQEVTFQLMEDMGTAYTVTITRKDTGEKVYESTLDGEQSSVAVSLTGYGKVIYEVKINGIWFAEQEVEFTAP
jgi:beta-lactam-binding protein with PASTA domain